MIERIKKLFEKQQIRFLFVGGLNTIVGYGSFAILLFLNVNYLLANTISYIIGIIHSYIWNKKFTFKSTDKSPTELFKFVFVYIVNYLIGMLLLFIMVSLLKWNPFVAGLINLVFTTLISWFGHKYFSFRKVKLDKKKIMWISLAVIFTALFLLFLYPDIMITTNASITFDDLLFKGKLYNLYSATYKAYDGYFSTMYITYDAPIYFFFGLWNLPLYAFTKLVDVHWENYFLCIIYAKSILLVLTYLSLRVMKKILSLFNIDNKEFNFMFLSSTVVMMTICMFGGYDILPILFILLGIYYYLKKDIKKFILFFAIAVSLKLFALFIFIPLVLLKEKNIFKEAGYIMSSLSILLVFKLIYHNAPMYYESMNSFEYGMVGRFFSTNITGPYSSFSLFTIIYVILCLWAYNKKCKDDKEFNLYTMYIGLITYGSFILLLYIHPQWSILLYPFMIFFLVVNERKKGINLLTEIVFSVSFMALLFIIFDWVFGPSSMDLMLVNEFKTRSNELVRVPFVINETVRGGVGFLQSISVASFAYFAYINYPGRIFKDKDKKETFDITLLVARMCILIPFAAIIMYYYFS